MHRTLLPRQPRHLTGAGPARVLGDGDQDCGRERDYERRGAGTSSIGGHIAPLTDLISSVSGSWADGNLPSNVPDTTSLVGNMNMQFHASIFGGHQTLFSIQV